MTDALVLATSAVDDLSAPADYVAAAPAAYPHVGTTPPLYPRQ